MKLKLPKFKKNTEKRKLKHKKKIFALIVLAGLGYSVWRIYQYFQMPVAATISPQSVLATTQENPKPKDATLKGKKFTMQYSSELSSMSETSAQNPGVIEQYQLMTQNPTGNDFLVVSIKTMPVGGLAGDSAYKLRASKTNDYTITTEQIDDSEVIFMESKTAPEIVALTGGNGMIATVAYRTGRAGVDVTAETKKLMQSFQWLN